MPANLLPFYSLVIPDVANVGEHFTSHEFILKLAERYQKEYVEALYRYRDGNPFQEVHRQLAVQLGLFPELVKRDGDEPKSRDIWGNSQACTRWIRVV